MISIATALIHSGAMPIRPSSGFHEIRNSLYTTPTMAHKQVKRCTVNNMLYFAWECSCLAGALGS